MTTEPGRLTPVAVGEILAGKYAVERILGSGGMGVVVAAKHLHLEEKVAIKFLLPQALKKAEVKQRFEKEARIAMRIKSEHVARIFDAGTLEDGAPYMVMEYLDGTDLSVLLKSKGAFAIDVAVEYVLQACEAIAEAHALGIIHRDLKPANLFLTRRADGSPSIKVIDFGISKSAEAEGDTELTKTDVMMGSPVYMAPEQMISSRDVDNRADVWSLGVILYFLIMGSQPFRGNSVTQLYASILEGPPRMRETRPDVPQQLADAVAKCLQTAKNDRWNNVAELALAVAEFGPPDARLSAARVARTLGVTAVPRSNPPPSSGPVASMTPPSIGATGLHARGEATPGGPEVATGQHTQGSWGGTQGPLQRGRSRSLVIAIVVAALVGVLTATTVMWLRGPPNDTAGPGPDPSSTQALGSAPTSGGTLVSPAGGVSTDGPGTTSAVTAASTASARPPASASASAPAVTAPVVTATKPGPAPHVTARPTARPTATATRPKTDLFSDPH